MEGTPSTPSTPPPNGPAESGRKKIGRGLLWGLLAVVIAFFAGFFWQFYEATTVREDLTAVEQELQVERLRVQLAQAALAAQAADYEDARQRMSSFFTSLQDARPALPARLDSVAGDFLGRRDQIITGLSRSNHEFAAVLYGMLRRFEEAAPGAGSVTGGNGQGAAPGGEVEGATEGGGPARDGTATGGS